MKTTTSDFRYRVSPIEWQETSYDLNGVHVNAWTSDDGRFTIEQHPQAMDKFLLTDRNNFCGIYRKLEVAQSKAQRKRTDAAD